MLNVEYVLHKMEQMPEYNRKEYLYGLVETGLIHRGQFEMLMNKLHCDEMEREERADSPFMKSARRMLRQAEEDFQHPKRKKTHECPHCHGIGKRYVTKSISIRQGNYRRADGSYHMEKDGKEVTNHYEWKICPDCHGTGKVCD